MKNIWIVSLLATFIILVDQFTKGIIQAKFALGESIKVIDGFFSFTYVRNAGAAFGMAANYNELWRLLLLKIGPVIVVFILIYLIYTHRNKSLWICVSYGLITSGAIGNLIDRFSMDYVVDFLDFYIGSSHFPAFNVADSVINIGVAMILIEELILKKNDKKTKIKEV
ncbi:MAG: signal peptidase II [Halobacteriovoraceae bacterium]|nr:signal peptidase II [Halobacteriovoraceae bacterium]